MSLISVCTFFFSPCSLRAISIFILPHSSGGVSNGVKTAEAALGNSCKRLWERGGSTDCISQSRLRYRKVRPSSHCQQSWGNVLFFGALCNLSVTVYTGSE